MGPLALLAASAGLGAGQDALNFGGSALSQHFGQKHQTNMQREGQDFQNRMFDKSAEFQERMASTAYQRSMQDIEKAGLNPALMYGKASPVASGSPSASGGGGGGGGGSFTANGQSARLISEMMKANPDMQLKSAQKALADEQTANAKENNKILKSQAELESAVNREKAKYAKTIAKAEVLGSGKGSVIPTGVVATTGDAISHYYNKAKEGVVSGAKAIRDKNREYGNAVIDVFKNKPRTKSGRSR